LAKMAGNSCMGLGSSVTSVNTLPSLSTSTRQGPAPPLTVIDSCALLPSHSDTLPARSEAAARVGSISIQELSHCDVDS